MKSSIRDFLPSQLALNDVKTTETFTLKKIELKGGEIDYQRGYELNKAPIKTVRSITAEVNGDERTLERGIDYTVNEKSTIEFIESGTIPDIGSDFDVTYVSESILSRYIDSIEEGTQEISDEIGIDEENETVSGITGSKYISTASEEELEEIGKLFGELGKRSGRDVERYRQYLKSIAKVYTGSGRKKNVAEASAVVVSDEDNDIDSNSIEFEEYFDEQEFSIKLNEFEDHRLSLLHNVVDLADPSGVRFVSPIYSIDSDDQEYIEGPKPDLFKYNNIDSLDAFDDDFISPFNHKSPDKGEYPSTVSSGTQYNLPDFGIDSEEKKPIEFEWAEKIEDKKEFKENGGWSEFQWGSDSWSGDVDSGVIFTGVDWEFADWNKFPYTDLGIVGADSIQTSESVSHIISSRLTEDNIVSTTGSVTIIRSDQIFEQTISNDSTAETTNQNFENTKSNELVSTKINEVGWGTDWNKMRWADA
jgi:hypothetical protein